MRQKQRIAIIGAGCAGLFVALELAQRGAGCTVIDVHPPAAFASTRNQGWLQSGALYAAMEIDDIPTAQMCHKGYELIQSRYPGCLRPHIPCYFLFYREEETQMAIKRCQDHGIDARFIPMLEVKRREPILGNSRLLYAAEMPDVPFDSSKLLQEVVYQACEKGVQFCSVPSLDVVKPVWDGELWHIFPESDHEIVCAAVVIACGVYIPEMLGRMIPGKQADFRQTKIDVLVLQGEVAKSMLITVCEPHSPHLVPFNGVRGNGATICLSRTDEEITTHHDNILSSRALDRFTESLSDFLPGLKAMLAQNGPIRAHLYSCQKLHLQNSYQKNHSNRRPFCLSYAPPSAKRSTVFVFYPGKFTAAPIAARQYVDEIEHCLGELSSSAPQQGTYSPQVAQQKYYDCPQYLLTVRSGRLVFEPLT